MNKIKKDLPWVEKYRPRKLSYIVGNENIKNRFKLMIEQKSVPNMILIGPSGCGKTTMTLCLARDITGNYFRDAVLELNSSDDRGIKSIRENIKNFVQRKILIDGNINNCQQKIIILDEADSMTSEAQKALLSIMESYRNSSFIFLCSNIVSLIEAIQSRCIIMKFNEISEEDTCQYLKKICAYEKIKYTEKGIKTISKISNNDIRMAINLLQTCAYGHEIITSKNIYDFADLPYMELTDNILNECLNGNFREAYKQYMDLNRKGYDNDDIVSALFNCVKDKENVDEKIKIEYMKKIGKMVIKIKEFMDTPIQIVGLLASLTYISL
jgi:replication factor C subunit 2/4